MKKLLSGVLSLCLTATMAVPFVSAESMNYNDYVKDCVNFYKYQVRYNYEVNGTKFTHEYRVFDKDEIEKLNVIPGYISCEVEEYTPENAPFEIPVEMIETYKETIKEAFNKPQPTIVYVFFYDENGKKVHQIGTKNMEEAQKAIDEYDGEYATYKTDEFGFGLKDPSKEVKPYDTLSDAGYKEVALEYINETGSVLSYVDYMYISETVCKNIMEHTINSNENCTGYRIALYDDVEKYQSAYKTILSNDVVQSTEYILGDINDDKNVDLTDLTYLSLYLLGDIEFDDRQYASADYQTDGVVNLADLATFKEAIVNDVVPR